MTAPGVSRARSTPYPAADESPSIARRTGGPGYPSSYRPSQRGGGDSASPMVFRASRACPSSSPAAISPASPNPPPPYAAAEATRPALLMPPPSSYLDLPR
jgi:hypothetical protein